MLSSCDPWRPILTMQSEPFIDCQCCAGAKSILQQLRPGRQGKTQYAAMSAEEPEDPQQGNSLEMVALPEDASPAQPEQVRPDLGSKVEVRFGLHVRPALEHQGVRVLWSSAGIMPGLLDAISCHHTRPAG